MEAREIYSLSTKHIKAENINATILGPERTELVRHAGGTKLRDRINGAQSDGRQIVRKLKQWRRAHLPAKQSLQAARCRAKLAKGFDLAGLAG